jgi:hypothetical protein
MGRDVVDQTTGFDAVNCLQKKSTAACSTPGLATRDRVPGKKEGQVTLWFVIKLSSSGLGNEALALEATNFHH